MRTWLAVMILAGIVIPVQALELPGFGKKKNDTAAQKEEAADTPSEQTSGDSKSPQKEPKADAPFPIRVTNADISGENLKFLETYLVVQTFSQRMQLPDGSLTAEPGRVLVFQKGESYVISFYRPLDGAYVLVGQPVTWQGVGVPREDFHQTHNLPTVVAKRNDGQGLWRVFVQSGKTVNEAAADDTVAKASEATTK